MDYDKNEVLYIAKFPFSFQYVLAAATSIATKVNEETLTYLNQGQSYEIKLKKLGDLSAYRGKILKVFNPYIRKNTRLDASNVWVAAS